MIIEIEKFPERLKEAREKANLSKSELARRIYVNRVSVTRWESGESSPSIDDLARLCVTLNVTAEYLLGGE